MKVSHTVTLHPSITQNAHGLFTTCRSGTGSYACLKVDQLPTNEVFVGIDNDFSDTNHYLELGGQLAATFHAKQ
jgi:hypothetical protein